MENKDERGRSPAGCGAVKGKGRRNAAIPSEAGGIAPRTRECIDLGKIRAEIDEIDDEILRLFLRRMELASRAAACKREKGKAVKDPGRESEILGRISAAAGDMAAYALPLFETLFALSRSLQSNVNGEGEPDDIRIDR